jgi:hypothetical protein
MFRQIYMYMYEYTNNNYYQIKANNMRNTLSVSACFQETISARVPTRIPQHTTIITTISARESGRKSGKEGGRERERRGKGGGTLHSCLQFLLILPWL